MIDFSSEGRLCALRLALISSLSLLASDCGLTQWLHNGFKMGPEYCCPPPAQVAEHWIDIDDARVIPCPPDCPDWWSVFRDPVLDSLIQAPYEQNMSLREAGRRVMQARSQRAYATGNLFPQTQKGFGEYEHIQESKSVAPPRWGIPASGRPD